LFVSVLADSEAIADELNPLTISHIPRNISFNIIGRAKKIVDAGMEPPALGPNKPNKPAANNNVAPIRPQTDKNRGMSFD